MNMYILVYFLITVLTLAAMKLVLELLNLKNRVMF